MVHDILVHIKHVFISMEINANCISGNQHRLLDVHMVNLKPFVDDISIDPKNDLDRSICRLPLMSSSSVFYTLPHITPF
jgi:hypothetical protein